MSPSIYVGGYHGSGTRIDAFDYAFTNQGADQIGSGFYVTTSLKEAIMYTGATREGLPKLGGTDSPTVHVLSLGFRKLLDATADVPISPAQVKRIILRSPMLDRALSDFGDVDYEGRASVLARAIPSYVHRKGDGPTIKRFHSLANDFYRNDTKAFNQAIFQVLGYDGITVQNEESTHYLAFFPEQISIEEYLTVDEARQRLAQTAQESRQSTRPKAAQ